MTSRPGSQELRCGDIAWAVLEPVQGREQGGRRPVVVISSDDYLQSVTTLAMIIPITTVDRGWPNHIGLTGPTGLSTPSWAMTEQIRTISRSRLVSVAGSVDQATLDEVRGWLRDFLNLA